MPNPNTIIVVSESKYFGRFIKLSIFYISLFPQSKLKLYSHNCNFLFQNVSAKFAIDFLFHSVAVSHNCKFVSRNSNFYLPNCNFTVVTLCLVIANLYFKMLLNILKMQLFFFQIVTWYHNTVSNIIFFSNNCNFAFQNISLFLPIVTLYHIMLQLSINCDIIFCKVTL